MNTQSTRARMSPAAGRRLAGFAAVVLLAWPLSLAAAQGTPAPADTEAAVARLAGIMAKSSPEAIWDSVMELRAYGKSAIEPIGALYPSQEPVAKLGLAAVLVELDELEDGVDRALGLLTDKSIDTTVRLIAAQLVTRYGKLIESRDFSKTLAARLEDFLDDPINPLAVKVAVSQTLYDVCGNPRGRRNLLSYLKSDDLTVRNLAALALAEIGQFTDPDVKDVLGAIQDESGTRGQVARTYLFLDYYQRKLEQAQNGSGKSAAGGDWALLTEIEQKIKEFHIYGDGDLAKHGRLVDQAAKGMMGAMDRHSTWYTPKDYKAFEEDLNRDYGGIGAYVGFRGEPPTFTILRPIYSGPAYDAGLRSRDVIWEVDGWPTDGKSIEDIIRRLKGEPGSTVELTVFRPGWKKERQIKVKRDHITIASCQGVLLPGHIGYISMSHFSDDTSEELVRLLTEWRNAGTLSGIVLDLRNNGGGYLETARDVADQFLPKGELIVYSEGRNLQIAPRQELRARIEERFPGIPMVVLINGASASASEIVTGALKVHKRATVVGLRSFGKGSVQQAMKLKTEPEGRLRVTIARYYLPDGSSIHKEIDEEGAVIKGKEGGIDPDIIVEQDSSGDIRDAEELLHLEQLEVHRKYIDEHLDADDAAARQLFEELVLYGETRGSTFPDFDSFYAGLGTTATQESVKRMLRFRAREVLQDLNKAEYLPLTPIDEDEQLQVALMQLYRDAKLEDGTIEGMERYTSKYNKVIAQQEELQKRYAR